MLLKPVWTRSWPNVFQHQCWENCGTLKGWKPQSVGSQLRTALCFVCLLLLPTDWAREGRGQPGVQLLWEDRKLSPLHRGWNKHSSRQTGFIFSQVWFEFLKDSFPPVGVSYLLVKSSRKNKKV